MSQKGFDILREVTDSRYRLSLVVGRRAAQLKQGVPSTVTNKVVPRGENAVTEAMRELELGTGVVWGDALPSAEEIGSIIREDRREFDREAAQYSVTQNRETERESSPDMMYGRGAGRDPA